MGVEGEYCGSEDMGVGAESGIKRADWNECKMRVNIVVMLS